MSLKKRLYRAHYLSLNLCEELKDSRVAADSEAWETTKSEMNDLCEKAFELALSLRGCKARYKWSQGVPASHPASDIELIGPFNVSNNVAELKPVRVLFGPVYKVVDGDSILLRKGDVLNGSD